MPTIVPDFALLGIPILAVESTVAICLSAACFFSEFVVGPIWVVPGYRAELRRLR
jgi:hypothetical protein